MRKDSRTWIWATIFSILGALLNRIRGGGWNDLWGKKIWYPLMLGTLGLFYGLPWWSVLVLAPLWYLGQQIYGWGNYFGCAIYGAEGDMNEDSKWINKICWGLEEKGKHFAYGVCTLWIRGAVWNLFPVLGLQLLAGGNESQIAFVAVISLFFGLIPYVLGRAMDCGTGINDNHSKTPWNISEILWGFLQTGGWCWVLENIGGF